MREGGVGIALQGRFMWHGARAAGITSEPAPSAFLFSLTLLPSPSGRHFKNRAKGSQKQFLIQVLGNNAD